MIFKNIFRNIIKNNINDILGSLNNLYIFGHIDSSSNLLEIGDDLTLTWIPTGVSEEMTYTYQWIKDGISILGETSNVLVVNDVTVLDAGLYYVLVIEAETGRQRLFGPESIQIISSWILEGGIWSDDNYWIDSELWDDGDDYYNAYLLALNYQERLIEAGGSALDSAGLALVMEVFKAAEDNSATVANGWLFGSEVNVNDRELQINLVDTKPSIVPVGTLNATTALSDAMLAIRIEASGTGYETSDGSQFFTETGAYSVLLMCNTIGDPIAYGEASVVPLTNGSLLMANDNQVVDYPGNMQAGNATAGGDATHPENQIYPGFLWFVFDGLGNWTFYHVSQGNTNTPIEINGPFDTLQLGNYFNAGFGGGAGATSFSHLLRFDGTLSDADRTEIFNRVYSKWRAIGKSCLIVGNSVTISGVSDSRITWPALLEKWGQYNSMYTIRRAQGAQRLPKFAPTGYALPGPPPDADIATMSIDILDWFAANVFINDDQQNMVGSGQPWTNWVHCHNAFTTYLQTLNSDSDIRAIMCTQIAHAPYTFDGSYTFLPYPAFGNSNWRQVSIATRAATLSDFNNVPTTIADIWTAFNLGYDTPDDGNAPDPLNDYANGDTSLFTTSDPQHPNDAGHAVMFDIYRDKLIEVIGL